MSSIRPNGCERWKLVSLIFGEMCMMKHFGMLIVSAHGTSHIRVQYVAAIAFFSRSIYAEYIFVRVHDYLRAFVCICVCLRESIEL